MLVPGGDLRLRALTGSRRGAPGGGRCGGARPGRRAGSRRRRGHGALAGRPRADLHFARGAPLDVDAALDVGEAHVAVPVAEGAVERPGHAQQGGAELAEAQDGGHQGHAGGDARKRGGTEPHGVFIGTPAPNLSPFFQLIRRAARRPRCSGATMLRCTPVPSSSPARCVRRGTTSIRQQKWSAPRGAVRTHRFSGGLAPSRRARRPSASCSSAAPVGPSSSKRARGAPRREHQLEGQRATRRARCSTASSSIATIRSRGGTSSWTRSPSRLPPIVRVGVGGEALALARDRRRDEVERVELRVGVRQRRAALAALVDEHVHVGGVRVRAHPLAPARPSRGATCSAREVGERSRPGCGRVDDHLVRAARRLRGEQVGVARRRAGRGASGDERRVEVRHDAHASSRACRARRRPGRTRVHLGRRPVLVALGERVACRGRSAAPARRAARRRAASRARPRRSRAGRSAGRRAPQASAAFSIATCSMPASTNGVAARLVAGGARRASRA